MNPIYKKSLFVISATDLVTPVTAALPETPTIPMIPITATQGHVQGHVTATIPQTVNIPPPADLTVDLMIVVTLMTATHLDLTVAAGHMTATQGREAIHTAVGRAQGHIVVVGLIVETAGGR